MRAASSVCGVADVDLAAGDVVLAAVERGRLGEAGDRVFGRGVGRGVGARRVGGDRAVVDDAAAARVCSFIIRKASLRAEEHAGQVHVHDLLPLLVREVLERHRRRAAAGVVEEHVEAAERLPWSREQRLHGVGIADVGGHHQRRARPRRDSAAVSSSGSAAPAGERDAVAVAQQRERGGLADAAARAGDQRHPSGHVHGRSELRFAAFQSHRRRSHGRSMGRPVSDRRDARQGRDGRGLPR